MKRFLWLVSLLMIPVLCALIVLNAFQVSKNLGQTGEIAAQRQRAADSQGAVKDLAFDLQAMETSQRGYLVTGDASYLKTYNEANGRLASRFPELQSRLAASDRPAEARVESLAAAKIEEMNQTIALRQKGYRHRAFLIEESGSGEQLMAEARKSLETLAAGQAAAVARYDRELQDILGKAARQSALANALLLAIAAGAFFIFHRYRRRLEFEHRQQAEQLRGARGQVERLTSIIFEDFGVRLSEMESDAGLLLDTYGGYLPRQAHERVERIRAGTGEMISMVGDLSKSVPPAAPVRSAPVQEVQSRSA